jgi:prepilin-type N-terminal cleavage/methylation domain-containing protein
MVVLGSAGMLKLADLNAFRIALESWTALPHLVRGTLVIAIPTVELGLAGLWFAGLRRRGVRLAAAGFLVLVTAAYLAHAIFFEIPDCGCFGLIAKAQADRRVAVFLVARNGCLLGLLLLSLMADRGGGRRALRVPWRSGPMTRPGFTLLETILVIAIVGLLVSLLMPSLGRARQSAERLASRRALGQHAGVVGAYLLDWDDAYPIYADPDAMLHIIRSQNQVLTYSQYFGTVTGWNVALADMYYNGRSTGDDFQRKGSRPEYTAITPFKYSSAFLAHPEFWNERTRTGPDQWGGVRDAQVQWHSAKVVFIDSLMWDQTARPADPNYSNERNTDVSLLDGSARLVRRSEFEPPYPKGEGGWRGSAWDWGFPGLHTVDGVAGRDIR